MLRLRNAKLWELTGHRSCLRADLAVDDWSIDWRPKYERPALWRKPLFEPVVAGTGNLIYLPIPRAG